MATYSSDLHVTNTATFSVIPTAPTAAVGDNSTKIATTAFVTAVNNLNAPLNSPSFIGIPTAPTVATGTNTTQLATTAFVLANNSIAVQTAMNATGSAPMYACRAWVNFNGTGTPSIRASGNVSSITKNGTGDYTVNFTTAMPDVNYSCISSGQDGGNAQNGITHSCYQVNSSSCRQTNSDNNYDTAYDNSYVSVLVFR